MTDYKFDGKKYMTIGVREKLPETLVIHLLKLIEERKVLNIPMDYLQVFEIEGDGSILEITYKQEEPEYNETYILSYGLKINEKVFVIDDVEHITILLANEY